MPLAPSRSGTKKAASSVTWTRSARSHSVQLRRRGPARSPVTCVCTGSRLQMKSGRRGRTFTTTRRPRRVRPASSCPSSSSRPLLDRSSQESLTCSVRRSRAGFFASSGGPVVRVPSWPRAPRRAGPPAALRSTPPGLGGRLQLLLQARHRLGHVAAQEDVPRLDAPAPRGLAAPDPRPPPPRPRPRGGPRPPSPPGGHPGAASR